MRSAMRTVGQRLDDRMGTALLGCGHNPRPVGERLDLPKAHVLGRNEMIAHEVLKDHADPLAQFIQIVVAQVHAVQADLPQ